MKVKSAFKAILVISCLHFAAVAFADPVLEKYQISTARNIYAEPAIADLVNIPQNSQALQSDFSNASIASFTDYYAEYFKPWANKPTFDLTEIEELFIKRKPYYLENYAQISDDFYVKFASEANLKAVGTVKQKAIVTHDTMLRRLPTNSILFEDPNEAGEGYPFDYLQQDNLHIGEPLLISHFSKDGKFAFVLSATGSTGFVSAQDIAFVTDKFTRDFQHNLVMVYKNTPGHLLNDANKAAIYEVQMSSVLPLKAPGVLLIPIKNAHGQAELIELQLAENNYIAKPLAFSEQNVTRIIDQLVNQPYGWGGIIQHMDCARLVRNYFAVFGTHLPLLTKQQKFIGKVVDVSDLSPEQKKQRILQEAIPYQSFIYFPGHIALYLGTYNSEPIILHATWGLKLYDQQKLEYRYVIGKSVITTLTPGKELVGFDPAKSDLLDRAVSFSNFTKLY